MKLLVGVICAGMALLLIGCGDTPKDTSIDVKGKWIEDEAGQVMLDPQTSGLKLWRNKLLTVSDGSGHEGLLKHLVLLDPQTAKLTPPHLKIVLSEQVQQSCFGQYLAAKPDYEGLAVDPDDDRVFYLVTEDATRTGKLTTDCQQRFQDTGSTDYPTLLVKLVMQTDSSLIATHVRPLQFTQIEHMGDHPNDGFEGLAFGHDRTLYLGLEKDANGQARVFSLTLAQDFWQTPGFAAVSDPKLRLPSFADSPHPINGMDFYRAANGKGYLLAAARNDDQLWVIDVSGEKQTKQIQLNFLAATRASDDSCEDWVSMDNASIEGVAVQGETLWLVNDPWKRNYLNNIQCSADKAAYQRMAPLLFSTPIDSAWFD